MCWFRLFFLLLSKGLEKQPLLSDDRYFQRAKGMTFKDFALCEVDIMFHLIFSSEPSKGSKIPRTVSCNYRLIYEVLSL